MVICYSNVQYYSIPFEIDCKGKPLTKLYDKRDNFSFRVVLEFAYHNSYVLTELAVATQTFCTTLDLLQLGFRNSVMLLQDWCHHFRSFMIVIMNSRIVTVYHLHMRTDLFNALVFLSSFVYPGHDFLWATRWVFLERQRTLTLPVHVVHAPSFLVEFEFTFVSLYVLFWLFYILCCACLFFVPGLHKNLVSLNFSFRLFSK